MGTILFKVFTCPSENRIGFWNLLPDIALVLPNSLFHFKIELLWTMSREILTVVGLFSLVTSSHLIHENLRIYANNSNNKKKKTPVCLQRN